MKSFVKKIIPGPLIALYHRILAFMAALYYGYPSERMTVIGITGTSGKSTVVYLLAKALEACGFKAGATSTVFFKVAEKEWLNDKKMTMLGRFQTQRMLSDMRKAGCDFAIVETTSQGIEQFRSSGINYDTALITNLYPEHIEAHGGFENYKKAKMKLFNQLEESKHKKIKGKRIEKVSIVNFDDENCFDFLKFSADKKIVFSINNKSDLTGTDELMAENIEAGPGGISFSIRGVAFRLSLWSRYNIYNALAVAACMYSRGIAIEKISEALAKIKGVPGRMELIEKGQPFKVLVDYAFEPKAMEELYKTVGAWGAKKIIHVLGSAGGGRDLARRPKLGALAGKNAEYVIVTDEDPYDDDPMEIIDQVSEGALNEGKALDKDIFKILDRRDAIKKALSLAREGDLVMITGKGCEQAIVRKHNKMVPWDDRKVVKEELEALGFCQK